MYVARTKTMPVPEVGAEAPEFNLPSAQGGQLRLSMRTARGPVVVAFYRPWSEEDVAYFKDLAAKEDEINLAAGSLVGVGITEPDVAREFVRASGMKSYVLYDYTKVTGRQWGLFEKDKEHGEYTRPAVFIVSPEHKIVHAWTGERPKAEEVLARVSEISGLPKAPEETKDEEKEAAAKGEDGAAPKKMSPEERERIKAERRAAREAGQSVKTAGAGGEAKAGTTEEAPKKLSAEERERIKAERRAAREAGQSLKTGQSGQTSAPAEASEEAEKPKKLSAEDRERIKAERRAAREAGQSLKTGQTEQEAPAEESGEAEKPKKMSAEEREKIKAERRAAREAGQSLKKQDQGGGTEEKPAEGE
jgi:peroxiredoxin